MEMRDPLRIVRTTAQSPTSSRNWTGGGQWPKGTYEVVFHLSRDMTDPECEMVTKAIPNVTKVVGNYFVQAGTTAEKVGSKQDWYKDKLSDIEARATAHDEELARCQRASRPTRSGARTDPLGCRASQVGVAKAV